MEILSFGLEMKILLVIRDFFSCVRSTMYNDAVSLYVMLKRYRGQEYAMNSSGWVLLEAADQIFKLSRERVYNDKDGNIHYFLS